MKLRISEQLWSSLRTQLFVRDDVETAGLMLVESTQTMAGTVGVVREAFALPESAYAIRRRDQISIDPIALNRLTRPARDRGWGVFTIHTHPGASEAWFSHADNAGDARLMPSLACQMPNAPHGSLVVVDSGHVVARSLESNGALQPMEVRAVGRTLHTPNSISVRSEPWFARQEVALGRSGQARLRKVRVAVVGLGGIGSVVAMQLVHLGVGELVLIDGDVVEASNLSRIVGATQEDVGRTAKVEVARRYAESLGFSKIEIHPAYLGPEHEALLAGCDVAFSCVDRQLPRALLNQIAYRYFVPTIDLGTVFRVDDSGSMVSDAGRVVVIGPGRPCLSCWGHIDPHALRIESLAATDREALVREGYIEGAHEAQPSVMAFNTFVAGAGVIEFMRLVTSFAGTQSPPNRMAFSFAEGTVKRNSLASTECRICGGAENRRSS
ncbi:MAG: ThiF family adenylyltransferase [Pseudomonadota bacterium]